MSNKFEKKTLIIGVGNLYRKDDAIGILIARNLDRKSSDQFKVIEQSGEGTALMDSWNGFGQVIIIDAVSSGTEPGTLHCLDAAKNPIPSRFFSCSTHNFGVAEAIELARTLEQLPNSLRLYGIEGKNFEPGETLSSEVESRIESASKEILDYVLSLT